MARFKVVVIEHGYASIDCERDIIAKAGGELINANELPREKALNVGSEKAALLVGLADATPEPDTAEWLLEKGALPSGKRVADASTRELAEAMKKAGGLLSGMCPPIA